MPFEFHPSYADRNEPTGSVASCIASENPKSILSEHFSGVGDKHMKHFIIFAGNYGSGKTELSLNMALRMAEKGKTVLCDMDIVNPYFRSAESKEMLEQNGIRLIAPPFANTTVDIPALSAEVYAAFDSEYAVFDAGGDPVGATALGGFKQYFENVRDKLAFYYVVNARRPFQSDVNDAVEMLRQIQANSRLTIDALVNNTNMANETTADDLLYGETMCAKIGRETGLKVAFTSGMPKVLQEYEERGYRGEAFEIEIFTRPEWLDKT